jgi:hypothetical protein
MASLAIFDNAANLASLTIDPEADGEIIIDPASFDLSKHNATVTIRNPATGDHRTFRIRTETWGDDPEPKRVVALLTGADNESNYRSFGLVRMQGSYGIIRVYRKFQSKDGTRTAWETFGRMLENPYHWMTHKGLEYRISGHCTRCNRKLTHPESIDTGMGPTCYKALNGVARKPRKQMTA